MTFRDGLVGCVGPKVNKGDRSKIACSALTYVRAYALVFSFLAFSIAASAQQTNTIAEVQGDKAESPLDGKQVTVRGIVTARSNNGIFVQTPDDKVDNNPLTSEGIFVFLGRDGSFDGNIGDLVDASGTVLEYRPRSESFGFTITELGKSTTVKTLTSKNPLPSPVTLTANDLVSNKLDTLERYEGMRVKVDTLIVTGPTGGRTDEKTWVTTSDGVFFGTLPGVERPMREAGVEYFMHVGQELSKSVPYFDTNPEMLRVDSDAQTGAKPIDVTAGATVKNLVGVMDYSYRRYTLLVDAANPPTVEGNKSFVAVSSAGEREMTVGSFNIENFFDDEKNSDLTQKETILSKEYFQKRLNKASLAIRKVLSMPDVLGVVEVENLKALRKLAVKINADAVADGKPDPKYEAFLEEGNDGRGIDSGYLIKTTKVKVIETKQLGKDATISSSTGSGNASLFDRPPFLVTVQEIDAKQSDPLKVTVIVNHFKSYLGIDNEKDGNRVREKRKQEAEWLANFVAERAKTNVDEKLILCGDFNAFLFSDGYNDLIGTLKGKPDQKVTHPSKTFQTSLYDLADFMPDSKNKYSAVYGGSAQMLDHILINKNLLRWSENRLKFGYARVDADFPVVWTADETRPERLSDHDAPIVFLPLDPPTPKVPPMTSEAPAKPEPTAQKPKGNSDEMNSGILYGPNFSYALSAPKGWVLDNQSGSGQGLSAVFYQKGSSWEKGVTVMYTRAVKKDEGQSFNDIIKDDIDAFKIGSPALKVEDAKTIDLGKGKTAIIKYFSNDSHGNYEALAYLDGAKSVVLIVLTARTKSDFDSSLGAFQELVGSYVFLTDMVTIQK